MIRPGTLFVALALLPLGSAGIAATRKRAYVRPTAILRAQEGRVEVRCKHTPTKSWRGVELHPGDTLRVLTSGWASVSVEATGARYLILPGTQVRIDSGRISRLSGPMPRRGFEVPPREPEKPSKGSKDQDGEGPEKPER
ncbi:MAG: hypothetical protein ACO1SX_13135 [Actinomycetota bacterium]